MGGRGSKANFNNNTQATQKKKSGHDMIREANDFLELKQAVSSVFPKCLLYNSLKSADFYTLKESLARVAEVMEEFPWMIRNGFVPIDNIRGEYALGAIASAGLDGTITLDLDRYEDDAVLMDVWKNDVAIHGSPHGTDGKDAIVHEFGHMIERAIIHKVFKGNTETDDSIRQTAWHSALCAEKVVKYAYDNYSKKYGSSALDLYYARRNISTYAVDNYSETLAEAVSDYRANKENAKALSKEIWAVLKDELK